MVQTCIYCGERWSPKSHRKFYSLPLKNPDKLDDWIRHIDVARDKITASSRLCSDHFETTCFKIGGIYNGLKESAIPTIFGDRKSACTYCSKTRDASVKRSLHIFPLKNSKLLQQWLSNIPKHNYRPGKNSVLCSEHFERRFFKKIGNIKENAVPTIFNPIDDAGMNGQIERKQNIETSLDINSNTTPVELLRSPEIHLYESLPADYCGTGINDEADIEKPMSPKTLVQAQLNVSTDHNYEGTPRTTRAKLIKAQKDILQLKKETKVQKQRIKRMMSTIKNLKNVLQSSTSAVSPKIEVPIKIERTEADPEEFIMEHSSTENVTNICNPILKTEELSMSPAHILKTEYLDISPIYPSCELDQASTSTFYSQMEVSVKNEVSQADPEESTIEYCSAEGTANASVFETKKVQPSTSALSSQMEVLVKVKEATEDPEEYEMEYSSDEYYAKTSFLKTELNIPSPSKGTLEEKQQQKLSEIDLSKVSSESCNNSKKCIFCCKSSKKVGNRREHLSLSKTSDYPEKLKRMAKMIGDEPLIYRINENNSILFHKICKLKFYNKCQSSLKTVKGEGSLWYKIREVHEQAFEALNKFLYEEVIDRGHIYYLSDIFQIYKALLKDKSVNSLLEHDFENYQPDHLQDKILKHHGNDIIITVIKNFNRKKIVYKAGISFDKSLFEKLLSETSEVSKLRNVAYDIRNSVKYLEINCRNQLQLEDSLKSKFQIPQNLHSFMSYLIKGPECRQSNDDDDKKIQSLCQNIIHIINKGKLTNQDSRAGEH